MNVRCALMPGQIREFDMPEGSTINDLLARAGLSPEGFEITRNGEPATVGAIVTDRDTVLLSRKVKGNS